MSSTNINTFHKSLEDKIVKLVFNNEKFVLPTFQDNLHLLTKPRFIQALLIAFHPVLNEEVALIRKKLKIFNLKKLNEKETLEKLLSSKDENNKLLSTVRKESDLLRKKYNISLAWNIPLQIYIMSDTLPFYGDSSIEWNVQSYIEPSELRTGFELLYKEFIKIQPAQLQKDMKSWANGDKPKDPEFDIKLVVFSLVSEIIEKGLYPSIHITERINSPRELTEWVKKNWKNNIEPAVKNLPDGSFMIKADIIRFCLGLWLFSLYQKYDKNWEKIMTEIEEVEKVDDETFLSFDDGGVSLSECQKLVHETRKYLSMFFPL